MNLKDLETAVTNLSSEELAAFSEWSEVFLAEAWDRQIEENALAGRLDEAGQKADEEFDAGRCSPL
jgi:hypothetical protein